SSFRPKRRKPSRFRTPVQVVTRTRRFNGRRTRLRPGRSFHHGESLNKSRDIVAQQVEAKMSVRKGVALLAGIGAALSMLAGGILYAYILSGGLRARQTPSDIEKRLAGWIVRVSVPDSAKRLQNPLLADAGAIDVSAGRDLYKQKCENCHAYDGSGKT